MAEAFIFDAVRTPRGKGKNDGSLHEVKPVDLLSGLLVKLQQRHDFDPAALDDVVMGVVSPVGEQGSVIAKTAVLKAGWDFRVSGVQVNRFCASGLEAVNLAAQKVASGWEDLVIAGGAHSSSGPRDIPGPGDHRAAKPASRPRARGSRHAVLVHLPVHIRRRGKLRSLVRLHCRGSYTYRDRPLAPIPVPAGRR